MNPISNSDQAPESTPPVASFTPTSPTPTPVSADKPTGFKRALIMAAGVLLLALIGTGVYVWGQAVERQQALERENNYLVTARANEAVVPTPVIEDANTITVPLPNGRTATYPDTDSNRNITFASSEKGPGYVALSHRGIEPFLMSVDAVTLLKLCGPDGELAQRENIIVATMSTTVRSIEYSVENNCIDELATLRNTDRVTRVAATQLDKQVNEDLRQFYTTVVIK